MTQLSVHTRRVRLGMFWFVASLLILTLGPLPASADTFNFTSCDLSTGCGTATPPFGTVTLTQVGTSVTFDVVLTSGNRFVETGAGGGELFLFNDSLSGSTITGAYATLNGATVTTLSISGFTGLSPVKADGTGTFTASVECTTASQCNGGSTPNINDLHFTVTNATLAQLETKNGSGNYFVADILCGQTGCGGLTGDINVSTGPVPPVPEPASMLLFGTGLVTLGAKLRRRKSLNPVVA